jgi:glycosyltransferase involved in cell wall biosynthesis
VELARFCDVWVIADASPWQQRISDYLNEHGPIPHLSFNFIKRKRWQLAVANVPILSYVSYRVWLRRAFKLAKALHAEWNFDIAHQVTFAGFREPSHLYRLGIPFVWGPIGGAQNYPWRFLPGAGFVGALVESTRSVLNTLQLYMSPRIRAAARSAAAIFTANEEMKRRFRMVLGADSILLCDVGAAKLADQPPALSAENEPLRIVWSGRLIARKALELLLEALAQLPVDVRFKLTVVGDGPRRRAWQKLAQRRGIAQHIEWCGLVPQKKAHELLLSADVFVFTSLRDTTGTVVIEALAAGVPVICLDHQGAACVVTNECGIKIPVTNRSDVQHRLRDALLRIQSDRSYRKSLSHNARQRAAEYLWSFEARTIAEEYNHILQSAGSDAQCSVCETTESVTRLPHENLNGAEPIHVESLAH